VSCECVIEHRRFQINYAEAGAQVVGQQSNIISVTTTTSAAMVEAFGSPRGCISTKDREEQELFRARSSFLTLFIELTWCTRVNLHRMARGTV
jgi:hypothetical protein